jgi:hypothetical protein
LIPSRAILAAGKVPRQLIDRRHNFVTAGHGGATIKRALLEVYDWATVLWHSTCMPMVIAAVLALLAFASNNANANSTSSNPDLPLAERCARAPVASIPKECDRLGHAIVCLNKLEVEFCSDSLPFRKAAVLVQYLAEPGLFPYLTLYMEGTPEYDRWVHHTR